MIKPDTMNVPAFIFDSFAAAASCSGYDLFGFSPESVIFKSKQRDQEKEIHDHWRNCRKFAALRCIDENPICTVQRAHFNHSRGAGSSRRPELVLPVCTKYFHHAQDYKWKIDRKENFAMKIAIIGCGAMGRTYARDLREMSGVELVGICGTDKAHAEEAAAEINTAAFTSFEEMMNAVDPDVVCVTVPAYLHHEGGGTRQARHL
jgi:lactate dehydrogenase-like 2-hydroxyacid dehydrogenase